MIVLGFIIGFFLGWFGHRASIRPKRYEWKTPPNWGKRP